jgi:hypothetical protein
MHRSIGVFLLLLSLLTGQIAAAPSDWAVVERLAAGERIAADLSTGKTFKGKVDHVTPASVFIERRGKTIELKRGEVARLYRLKAGHGAKWAVIGAAIGAGAGGALGGAVLERETGFGGAMAGTVALCALIGAGVGYLIRGGKSVLIYSAPPRGAS